MKRLISLVAIILITSSHFIPSATAETDIWGDEIVTEVEETKSSSKRGQAKTESQEQEGEVDVWGEIKDTAKEVLNETEDAIKEVWDETGGKLVDEEEATEVVETTAEELIPSEVIPTVRSQYINDYSNKLTDNTKVVLSKRAGTLEAENKIRIEVYVDSQSEVTDIADNGICLYIDSSFGAITYDLGATITHLLEVIEGWAAEAELSFDVNDKSAIYKTIASFYSLISDAEPPEHFIVNFFNKNKKIVIMIAGGIITLIIIITILKTIISKSKGNSNKGRKKSFVPATFGNSKKKGLVHDPYEIYAAEGNVEDILSSDNKFTENDGSKKKTLRKVSSNKVMGKAKGNNQDINEMEGVEYLSQADKIKARAKAKKEAQMKQSKPKPARAKKKSITDFEENEEEVIEGLQEKEAEKIQSLRKRGSIVEEVSAIPEEIEESEETTNKHKLSGLTSRDSIRSAYSKKE